MNMSFSGSVTYYSFVESRKTQGLSPLQPVGDDQWCSRPVYFDHVWSICPNRTVLNWYNNTSQVSGGMLRMAEKSCALSAGKTHGFWGDRVLFADMVRFWRWLPSPPKHPSFLVKESTNPLGHMMDFHGFPISTCISLVSTTQRTQQEVHCTQKGKNLVMHWGAHWYSKRWETYPPKNRDETWSNQQ
jgi:hypothetical protein